MVKSLSGRWLVFPALILALVATLAALASCSPLRSAPTQGPPLAPAPAPAPPPAPGLPIPAPAPAPRPSPPTPPPAGAPAVPAEDRLVVRTGNMAIIVENVATAVDRIGRLADTYKGFVVSSNVFKEGDRVRGAITIRVQASDFETAMNAIAALAMEVTNRTTTAKDVTEEYTDLKSRLQNLEAAERQLLQIMEKAQKVEDVLAVQRELTRVRGDIEQTRGRMQYLERTTSTSLIDVRLEQSRLDARFTVDRPQVTAGESVRFTPQVAGGFSPYGYQWDFGGGATSTLSSPTHGYVRAGTYSVSLKVTDDRGNVAEFSRKDYITVLPGWAAGQVLDAAWNGLVGFGQGLASLLIWVGVFSPVWVVIGVAAWYGRRRLRRSGRGRRGSDGPGPAPPAPPAPAAGGGAVDAGHSSAVNTSGTAAAGAATVPDAGISPKSRLVAVLLVSFLGAFGAHRFYVGRLITAAAMLLLGVAGLAMVTRFWGIPLVLAAGIWAVVDFALLLAGRLRDGRGLPVRNWAA